MKRRWQRIAAVATGSEAAGEVDAAARSVLRKHKLEQYFTHSPGHGLGIEIHESPRLAAGQTQSLEAGMIVTIEPGVYIPGAGAYASKISWSSPRTVAKC